MSTQFQGLLRRFGTVLIAAGFDPRRTWRSLRALPGYLSDLIAWLMRARTRDAPHFNLRCVPTLADRHADGGVASGHYFHQDLWAARQIHAQGPARHIDVGSRIDGFVAHLLSFRQVEVVDIRRLTSAIQGLHFHQADLMAPTPPTISAADSVSCLHALEHFGLGRYGDPVTPDGWRLGLANLAALVLPGGRLYLGVPIGKPAVEFNAQRIFHPRYLVDEARRHGLQLGVFAYVDDAGQLHEPAGQIQETEFDRLAELDYGCGLYVFQRAPAGVAR